MIRPSAYPRQLRRFSCLRCNAEVYRPEVDRFDDWIYLNCRFGRALSDHAAKDSAA